MRKDAKRIDDTKEAVLLLLHGLDTPAKVSFIVEYLRDVGFPWPVNDKVVISALCNLRVKGFVRKKMFLTGKEKHVRLCGRYKLIKETKPYWYSTSVNYHSLKSFQKILLDNFKEQEIERRVHRQEERARLLLSGK